MEAIERADALGKALLPTLTGMIYGTYLTFFTARLSLGITLLAWGVLVVVYLMLMDWAYNPTATGHKKKRMAVAFFIIIPELYAALLALYLGLYLLTMAVLHYHGILTVLAALFWVAAGVRLYTGIRSISHAKGEPPGKAAQI